MASEKLFTRLLRADAFPEEDDDGPPDRRADRASDVTFLSAPSTGAALLPAINPAAPPMTRAAIGPRIVAFMVYLCENLSNYKLFQLSERYKVAHFFQIFL